MDPYYQDENSTIYCGNALDVLKQLPDESVNCCVTSPPYWGLRDYGIEPTIWDGDESCDHDFTIERVEREMRRGINLADSAANTRGGAHKVAEVPNQVFEHGFCRKCGAWRGCFGLEPTPELYVQHAVQIFREVRRVLRSDGTCWINIGDSYATGAGKVGDRPGSGERGDKWAGYKGDRDGATGKHSYIPGIGPMTQPNRMPIPGLKPKDLCMVPARLALALQADGWYLRQDIIWHKPNPMPESIRDRCTKAHEYIFLLSKSERYYYNFQAMAEPVTGGAHARGNGLNPKASSWKTPDGWGTTKGNGGHGSFNKEGREKGYTGYKAKRPRQNESFSEAISGGVTDERNRRSVWQVEEDLFAQFLEWKQRQEMMKPDVWTVATEAFAATHYATFPRDLIKPCILAGCPGPGKNCDCAELIETPTGTSDGEDPTMQTGRAGMNRPRAIDEGCRPITRREQREYAKQLKESPHRAEMEAEAGKTAFEHYIRTDRTGARPVPQALLVEWIMRGWLSPTIEPCDCPSQPGGVVLDPFGGSLTTLEVAASLHCRGIAIELKPEYIEIGKQYRLAQQILALQP